MPRIARVHPNSLATELELVPGDELLTVNGQPIHDIVDLQFAFAGEDIELEVLKQNGETWVFEVEKDYDEGLGVDWEYPTVDKVHLCHNKCVFCFVDQIPDNMRATLNVRDDDYRLSFLHGNFITMTNLRQEELQRIVDLKMSPLNVSVHTTNPELRVRMLANKRSGEILRQIAFLAEHGIEMNTQIVLCPQWNDGAELDRTIRDLAPFYPQVRTVSVVPVGLTKHRRGLHSLRSSTVEEAKAVIGQVEQWQKRFRQELGVSFVYIADEYYVLADMNVPPTEYYDDFGQTENGVGVIRTFLDEIDEVLLQLQPPLKARRTRTSPLRRVGVITGVSAQSTIKKCLSYFAEVPHVDTVLYPVVNDFYGHHVTVTGLLTGQDIIRQLQGRLDDVDNLLLPDVMLKDDQDVLLDNCTVDEVERSLKTRVTVVPATGSGLMYGVLGQNHRLAPRRRYEATLRNLDKYEDTPIPSTES